MGDLSAILQPFMLQDVDTRDDRPIPSYREGSRPYDVFLDKLRHPRAAEVVKGLQQFVAAFKARSERRKVGVMALSSPGPSMMHAFLGRLETQMRENVLWRRETESQWEETRESLERIVMHKVFSEAYGLAEDPQRDEAISERLRSLGFLREEHLGVPPLVDSKKEGGPTWSDAEGQLVKMSRMRCPGDMLACIIRCTRIVAGLLTGDRAGGVLPGADEFLPALIILVKRANPPKMHSSLEFVQSFRDPSKLLSEAGYVLTQLVSAVCFLEEVDASVLTIAHGDFERGLKGFQETAIVGLRAHQQEVRKEEEHERLLHRAASENRPTTSPPSSSSPSPPTSSSATTAQQKPVDAMSSNGTASANGGGGAAPPPPPPPVLVLANRSPGPATLPQASLPRQINPAEVRAKRIAGTRAGQLLLAPTGGSSITSSGSGGGIGSGSNVGGGSQKQQQQGEGGEGGGGGADGGRGITGVDSQQAQGQQARRRQGRQQQPQQHRQQQGRRRQVGPGPSQRLWELGESGSGLGLGLVVEGGVGAVSSQLRFVGATAAELRMSELPELLVEHQQLARLCEELLAERAELGQRRRRM
eukprot:jgi/Undpi1/13226/HiC_scaffold_8.g02888.m1